MCGSVDIEYLCEKLDRAACFKEGTSVDFSKATLLSGYQRPEGECQRIDDEHLDMLSSWQFIF
jgi:hypothetical protein